MVKLQLQLQVAKSGVDNAPTSSVAVAVIALYRMVGSSRQRVLSMIYRTWPLFLLP